MNKLIQEGKRFILCLGKFGTYFYDKENQKDMNNQEVLALLERYDFYNNRKHLLKDLPIKLANKFIKINDYDFSDLSHSEILYEFLDFLNKYQSQKGG